MAVMRNQSDALCKCRLCGAICSAGEWRGTQGGAACPSCGHAHFSIFFDRPATPQPTAPTEVNPRAVDAHGRHRRVVRREDVAAAPNPGSDFTARLRTRLGPPPKGGQD